MSNAISKSYRLHVRSLNSVQTINGRCNTFYGSQDVFRLVQRIPEVPEGVVTFLRQVGVHDGSECTTMRHVGYLLILRCGGGTHGGVSAEQGTSGEDGDHGGDSYQQGEGLVHGGAFGGRLRDRWSVKRRLAVPCQDHCVEKHAEAFWQWR